MWHSGLLRSIYYSHRETRPQKLCSGGAYAISNCGGGLHPRPSPRSRGNSKVPKVKQPKAGIVLGRVTVLALDFQCTLVHPMIVWE